MTRRESVQVLVFNILAAISGQILNAAPMQNKSKNVDKLVYIKAEGSPYRLGYQYSQQIRSTYRRFVDDTLGDLSQRFYAEDLKKVYSYISRQLNADFPYLIEELHGMAEGAKLDFDAVAMANLAPAYGVFINRKDGQRPKFGCPVGLGFDDFTENDGCTNIIFPESDEGPILGRTLDASTPYLEVGYIRLIVPENGYKLLCFTSISGLITNSGVNEHGLGIGDASLHFPSVNPRGVIRNFLPRLILQNCANVEQGIQFLSKYPVMRHGYHFALVDKDGYAAIVERSPLEMYVRRSISEPIFCTNHAVTPCMRKLELSRGEIGDKNSDERYAHLKLLTSAENFQKTFNSMKNLVCSHRVPGGICQHGELQMYTRRTFLVSCRKRKFLVTDGPACQNEFREFKLT
jgi:predicted choloylglycine hydrolase